MPERTCVGCRAKAEKATLVRIVHRDGAFVVDATQTEPGRGVYLHPGCAAPAAKNRGVQRGLRLSSGPDAAWFAAFPDGPAPGVA